MKRIYLLWILMFAVAAHAQQITFRTSYDIALLDIPGSVIQNPQKNYVLTGTNTSFIPLYGNVTQLDTAGNVMWSKGYSGGGIATQISDAKNVSSGGYIAAGSSGNGLMLMRLDAAGAVTWSNRYHIGGGTDEYASRVIESSDGGFLVAGYVYGATPPASTVQDSANLFCLKVNSGGTLQWAKTFFISTAFQNDHVLNDVAEVSDGYIFVGSRSVDAVDDNGSYAVVLKTNTTGTLQWFYRYGSSSSEANSVVALSGTEVMIGGDDNSRAYYLKVSSAGASNGGNQYNFGLLNVAVPYNTFVTNDGQYAMVGQYLAPLAFTFASYVMKMNASNGNVVFSRGYNSGLSAILPEGMQAQDSGYVAVMTAQQMTGFNYHIVKTDKNGFMNNVNCDTIVYTAPSRSGYTPTLTSATPTEISTISTNSISVSVATLSPTQVVECLVVPCTNPPTPTASASANPICSGSSTTISGSGSGSGVTYKVYNALTGGTLLGTAPLSVSPTSTTPYYVEAESSSGCVSTRASVTVTVNQPPSAVGTITGATSPCPSSQAYSISAVSGATSYTWSVSGGGSITGGQGTTSITINWTTAGGPYTVSVTATNTCGSTSNTKSVTVQTGPPAAVGAITGSTNPCPGAQTYSISAVANATSYTWSVSSGGTISSGQGTTSISVNWTTSGGPYTVSVTATNSCGSTSNSTAVTVQTSPPSAVGAISGSAAPCPGNQTYSIGAVTNATSYTWSISGGGSITSGQGSTSININWTTSGGPYTVSVTASNSCGNTSNSIAVNVVNTISGVSVGASPNPSCVGNTVNLNGSGTNVTTWAWSGPNSYSSSSQNPSVTNIQINQAGTYTLTASNACGSATASVNVSVNDVPQNVSANANPNPACAGNTVNLTGSGTNVTSWSWSGPNTFSAATQNASVISAQINASGTYTLTATNTCGNTTATVNVTVNDLPQSVTATANPTSVCPGAVLNLSGSASGATAYSWTGPNSFSSTQLNNTINNFQAANAGTYILTATNNCGGAQNSVVVSISSGPTNTTATANLTNICSNSNLSLSGSATGATSYSWSGPNSFSSSQQNPSVNSVTLRDSGLYVLVVSNICGTATASVNVDVDTLIQNLNVNAQPNDTVCAGANINLIANGTQVNTWSWTGPNTFSSSQQNPVIANSTVNNSGTYTVTASNACGNQSSNVSVLVNNPIQNLSASASSNGLVCSGSSITFSATGSNVNSWSWTGPNGFSTTQQNPVINPATTIDNGTYTVTALNACGNQNASVAIQIDTTIENLSASASPNDTLCAGSSINLNANGTNVNSWSWTGPNAYSSTQQNPVIANSTASNSGTYTLTASNACGNQSSNIVVLVNNPVQNLSASASSNGLVCSGSSVTLSASGTNVNSWSWSGPNSFSSTQQNPVINPATTIDNGTYTVTAFNACGNQTASVTVQIDTAIENLSASALPNDTLCVGDTIRLSGNVTNVTSWSWSGPNGFSSTQQSVTIVNLQTSSSGTYILTGTNTCGSVSDSARVFVNTTPSNLGPISGLIWSCANTLATYSISPVPNAYSYVWTLSGGGTIISGQGTDTIRIQWGNIAGSYTVRVVVSNNCGIINKVLPVTLYPPIPVMTTQITGDSVLCQNQLGRYQIDTVANVLHYMWFSDSAFYGNGWIYAEVYFSSPGVHKVYAYAVGACGNSDTISYDVLVHSLPTPPTITITSPVCRGDIVTITGFSPDSSVELHVYTTYPPGGNYLGPSPYSFNTASATAVSYFVEAVNQYGCRSTSGTASYTIIEQPSNLTGRGDTICFDNSATLTATFYPPTFPATITWWDSPSGGTQLDTGNIFTTPNLTQNTTYYISTYSNGCQSIAPRVPVTAYIQQPIIPFGIDDTTCFDNSASLKASFSPTSGNTTVTWWDSPSGGTPLDSGNIFTTPNLTQTTTYYINTVTNGCQSFASRVPVTAYVYGQTTVVLTTDHANNTILVNEVLTFTALPDSLDNYEFFWNGTSVQSGDLNTWASSKLNDLDSVWVIATDNGCESVRGEVLVHVMDFPNAFTPNGDGTNDVFLKGYDLIIINRWGQELYEGREGWDGKYKGDKVSPGTYYYIVTLDNITDRKNAIKGTVLLIED